ncbi:hypothetical protein [Schlesneria sp. DSM 10557]|uniref:hypothetical protein n=1 Tax=Schlesneria sp. DSM 10557 TaxID=3044399 RepID=UPI0035A145D4
MTDGPTLRDRLLQEEAARKEQRELLRQRVIRAYVRAEDVSYEDLEQSGLTVADLEEFKLSIERRRDLRRKMDLIDGAQAEITQRGKDIGDLVKQRDQLIEQFNSQIYDNQCAVSEAQKRVANGKAARAELIKSCRHPEALSKLDELERRCEARLRDHETVSGLLKDAKNALDDCRNRLSSGHDSTIAERAVRLDAEIQTLDQRRLKLDQLFEDQKVERKAIEDEWCCNPELI